MIMVENPFFHRTPIRDQRYFFGRIAETSNVFSCITRNQPVSIVGPRRIGHTSLLFHLSDPQVRTEHGLGDDYVFVYIDCQVLSDLTKSDVYHQLLEQTIKAKLDGQSAEHDSQEPITYLGFKKYLDEIAAPNLKIVFLFDEFEAIVNHPQLGRDFLAEMRALGETNKVVLVIASGRMLYDLSFHDVAGSPFFDIFSTVWLGFMKPDEASALVNGLSAMVDFGGFDENDHAFLQQIAGPHPFYLQVACRHLFDEKIEGTGSTVPDYERVKRLFARDAKGHFQYAWERLSEGERTALRLVGDGCLDKATAEDIERLEQKCLVYQGKVFSSVLAEFVKSSPVSVIESNDVRSIAIDNLAEVRNHLDWLALQSQNLTVVGSDSEFKGRLLREFISPLKENACFLFGKEESFQYVKADRTFTEEDIHKLYFGVDEALHALRSSLTDSQRALLAGYQDDFNKRDILDFVKQQDEATSDTLLIIGDRFDEISEVSYLQKLFVPDTISLVPTGGEQSLDMFALRICRDVEAASNGRVIFVFGDSTITQLPISTLQEFSFVRFWLLPSSYDAIRNYVPRIDNFIVLRTFKQPILDALEEDLGIPKFAVRRMDLSCFVALGDFSSQLPLVICLRKAYKEEGG